MYRYAYTYIYIHYIYIYIYICCSDRSNDGAMFFVLQDLKHNSDRGKNILLVNIMELLTIQDHDFHFLIRSPYGMNWYSNSYNKHKMEIMFCLRNQKSNKGNKHIMTIDFFINLYACLRK